MDDLQLMLAMLDSWSDGCSMRLSSTAMQAAAILARAGEQESANEIRRLVDKGKRLRSAAHQIDHLWLQLAEQAVRGFDGDAVLTWDADGMGLRWMISHGTEVIWVTLRRRPPTVAEALYGVPLEAVNEFSASWRVESRHAGAHTWGDSVVLEAGQIDQEATMPVGERMRDLIATAKSALIAVKREQDTHRRGR